MTHWAGEHSPWLRLGGISAIEFTGKNHEVPAAPRPRTWPTGRFAYRCRFHIVKLDRRWPGQKPSVTAEIQSNHAAFRMNRAKVWWGSAAAHRQRPTQVAAFRPRGSPRRSPRQDGSYRTNMVPAFTRFFGFRKTNGHLERSAALQDRAGYPADRGRRSGPETSRAGSPNGGLEGLAIIPDGTKLYASMQRPVDPGQPAVGKAGDKRTGNETPASLNSTWPAGDDPRVSVSPRRTRRKRRERDPGRINSHEFPGASRRERPKGGKRAVTKKFFKVDLAGGYRY